MKAISYSRYGGPEVLEYGERPDPKVGPDSVLVKVRAAAVNPVDWKAREGYLDALFERGLPGDPRLGRLRRGGPDRASPSRSSRSATR